MTEAAARDAIDRLFREESGRAVATLIRVLGDFDLAEEAVQEAFVVALEVWPERGLPANPGAWIVTTARNRAIDRLRRRKRLAEKSEILRRDAEVEAQLAAFRAVVVIHAPGLRGTPCPGQVSRARANASWTASSARSKSPRTRIIVATARPDSSRNRRSTTSWASGRSSVWWLSRTG